MFAKINHALKNIKHEKPLILNITNDVTMDFVANGLLSLGASPIMSKAEQEIEDLLQIVQAVVINIGTLDEKFIALCKQVCEKANLLNKPIILDPVGAGASRYRTENSLYLIQNYTIDIIRGNASEIMALFDHTIKTKGVDSTTQSEGAIESAQTLSHLYDAAIVVSGETDVIIDKEQLAKFSYGSSMMPTITGTGCLLSAVVAAFRAFEKDRFAACLFATVFYGLCGENAAHNVAGPASFKVKFIDELSGFPSESHDAKK